MNFIKNAIKSIRYRTVGTDAIGNTYFESKALNQFGRTTRYVEYSNKNANDASMDNLHLSFDESTKLPVGWQSWLRHTRQDPPE